MAATFGWEHYVGLKGQRLACIDLALRAAEGLLKFFNFTADAVVAAARKAMAEKIAATYSALQPQFLVEKFYRAYLSNDI